ncbi:protein-disulfide isomerase [Chthonomonas calidirosea]|uniref:Protein-disulfide isomerase n=2 Tax=Chthonomonas TaxID=1077265 RepID=S0EWC4_CHTCT|nr:Protein-disulfide isomerase [Chthonomonas calidirosea T49]CEK18336.1 protein-disulfide isomerase [Chthonomonas calidirosea]
MQMIFVRNRDVLLVGLLAFISLSALSFTIHKIVEDARRISPPPTPIAIAPTLVIGAHPEFFGDPHAPFTLVEFGDYQCPPCYYAATRIPSLIQHSKGRLRFVFRNFPIESIHPLAMQAAVVAEVAKRHGKFLLFHDAIYANQISLSSAWLNTLLQSLHLSKIQLQQDESYARRAIAEDVAIAKRCGLTGTPFFLLITPQNRVYRLTNIEQVRNFVPL